MDNEKQTQPKAQPQRESEKKPKRMRVSDKIRQGAGKIKQRVSKKRENAARKRKPAPPVKLKLLVTVVPRNKGEFYEDLLREFDANLQMRLLAYGTASAALMGALGLEGNEKSVLLSVLSEQKADKAMLVIEEKFTKLRGGKGIAFTVPFSSVIGAQLYRFMCNDRSGLLGEDKQ